jgi:hypothetical protein
MMKRVGYWLLLLCLVLGCLREIPVQPERIDEPYPEGASVTVRFSVANTDALPMTKALGETPELDSLHLAVFGSSGYLKEYVKAKVLHKPTYADGDTVMTFEATLTLSDKERSIHFIGNGPSTLDFGYDYEILPQLLSAEGGQAFWQMKKGVVIDGVKKPDGTYEATSETNAQFQNIPLVRNFAKIVLSYDSTSNFTPDYYAVFSVPSRGSIVPYFDGGFVEDYQDYSYTGLTDTLGYSGHMRDSVDFIGLPEDWDTRKVSIDQALYLYERPLPNEMFPPSYIIVHGIYNNPADPDSAAHNNKPYFYRIDLIQDGAYYPIVRNFKYQINIHKILSIGHTSAQAAAASAGSADVSADITTSHLNDISDGEARLVVQPWMSHTFNKRQVNNNLLHVKFFDDVMSGNPNMDHNAVSCEILHNPGEEDIIESVSIGYPVQASGTEKGWRTVTFTTTEPGAPGTPTRTQAIRIAGSYLTDYGETRTLYRDVLITLQPLQQFQLSVDSPDDTGQGVPRDTAMTVRLNISIPTDLVESMFPLNFTIEPEDMSLTPDNHIQNNNLPVSAGTSISDHAGYAGKRAFQFLRSLSYDEYLTLEPSLDLDGEPIRTLTCQFKTTRKDNATTIWVANEFFRKSYVAYTNPPVRNLRYFYVEARDENIDHSLVSLHFTSGKVQYLKNEDGWVSYTSNSELRMKNGDRIYFRGNIANWSGADHFAVEGKVNVGGNIASLFRNDFTEDDLPEDWGKSTSASWSFQSFFANEAGLVDASALVLPMEAMRQNGYRAMFQNCYNLVAAPSLPAATLAGSCYQAMFQNCTALTTSPKLKAETLVGSCYAEMFSGCSSLNEITMIGRGSIPNNSLTNWVSGVAASGDFYGYVTTTLSVGVSGIPVGWVDRNECYVEAVADGTLSFSGSGLQYSKNWDDWTSEGIVSIAVSEGDIVRFRGIRSGGTISSTGDFKVGGNILSLAANDYTSVTTGVFEGVFKNATTLVSASGLVLPTELQSGCFKELFSGCTALTAIPSLPATDLAAYCYESMFSGCTSLATPPTLPATTLAEACYKAMFAGCIAFAATPQLPAETLAADCYEEMFSGCSNLAKVYCSAINNLGAGYTTNWLASVASSGLFVKNNDATTWPVDSPDGVPVGWTVSWGGFRIRVISNDTKITFNYNFANDGIEYSLDEGQSWTPYTTAITLNAGQVACIRGNRPNYKNAGTDQWETPVNKPIFEANKKCYISGNIMSLLEDKVNLVESAFQGAFSKGSGTAVTYIDIDPEAPLLLPATTLAPKCYMQMFRNCTSLTRAPVFRVEVPAYRSCYNMLRQCSNVTDASTIELPATTLAEDCYRELFRQCSKLEAVPVLPAPTLVKGCYQQMFSGSGIKSLTCLATDISAEDCTLQWMSGALYNTSTCVFYKAPGMNSWTTGEHGILSNWTVVDYVGQ